MADMDYVAVCGAVFLEYGVDYGAGGGEGGYGEEAVGVFILLLGRLGDRVEEGIPRLWGRKYNVVRLGGWGFLGLIFWFRFFFWGGYGEECRWLGWNVVRRMFYFSAEKS